MIFSETTSIGLRFRREYRMTLVGAIGLEGDSVFRGDGGRRKYSAGCLAGPQTDRQDDGGGQMDNATNGWADGWHGAFLE